MAFPLGFPFAFPGTGAPVELETLVNNYKHLLHKLFPPGVAFTHIMGSDVDSWVAANAPEFARLHQRALVLLNDSFPGDASERLDEWEELCGLPDECSYLDTTIEQRQDAVMERFAISLGQGEGDFEAIATEAGYSITITLWDTFRTGIHTIGHMPMYSTPWYYAMNVTYTPQSAVQDAALQCKLTRHAHAHTVVQYNLVPADMNWDADYFVSHPRT